MSWFGLFTSAGGATAPREENLKPKAPTATRNNSGKNTVVTVAPADPNATKLKVVPHPTASAPAAAATQQGGRRSAKGRKTKGKSRGRKNKKRSTRK